MDTKNKINPKYTFSNLIVGSYNTQAVNFAMSVADNKWSKHLNPIIINGNSGMGKSHIMQAIYSKFAKEKKVNYCTAHQLVSEFTHAIVKNEIDDFIKLYSSYELLLIDDIDYLKDKFKTQEFLLQIIDQYVSLDKTIVFSISKSLKNIELMDKFKSRLLGSLLLKIEAPNKNELEEYISIKADQLQIELDHKAIHDLSIRKFINLQEVNGAIFSCGSDKCF